MAHLAYAPSEGRVLGLSKLVRLVHWASRRPQMQERLTRDIVGAVERAVRPRGAAVALCGVRHLCMSMRGVACPQARADTSAFSGCLDAPGERAEFLAAVRAAVAPPPGALARL